MITGAPGPSFRFPKAGTPPADAQGSTIPSYNRPKPLIIWMQATITYQLGFTPGGMAFPAASLSFLPAGASMNARPPLLVERDQIYKIKILRAFNERCRSTRMWKCVVQIVIAS